MTTNKYERAAKFLAESGSAELRTYGELLDTQAGYELLRAAAKLPATVDAVKVLKMYAAGELVERAELQALNERVYGTCFLDTEDCGHCDYCTGDDLT